MKLTKTDREALKRGDSNYLVNKGANAYSTGNYKDALAYYQLGAAMGNDVAISNLGYCYLYGRDVEADTDLAVSYFELAADKENIEACYKLGNIYESDKWGLKDEEMSVYYYRMAASYIINDDWEDEDVIACTYELMKYPSLCFALGRAMLPGGNMRTDIYCSYQFLKHAEKGYQIEILNGADYYDEALDSVEDLINDSIFDDVREDIDPLFEDDVPVDFN